MSRSRPYAVLDVFTTEPLAGNALAVVQDADGIEDELMLRFARETRLSETTFVQTSTEEDADYRNRIFTIGGEVPFAGHPSLGTAVAVARARAEDCEGERGVTYVQETGAGLQPVDVLRQGEGWYASVLQEPAEYGAEPDPADVWAAAGLPADCAHPALPPAVVTTGLPTLIAPVAVQSSLAAVAPDLALVAGLLHETAARTLYLVAVDPEAGRAYARMFSPLVVDGEDPATGSAAGPLCAYLHARVGTEQVTISQGLEMGRPSRLEAQMDGDRVRVGGGVVPVVEGTVSF